MYKRFIQELVDDVKVDMDSDEIKDICEAVAKLSTKLLHSVEKESPFFKSSEIVPCGSMAEGTRIWKFTENDKTAILEFDFLSILEDRFDNKTFDAEESCAGFMRVKQKSQIFPGDYQNLEKELGSVGKLNSKMISFMFRTSMMKAVESLCTCFKFDLEELRGGGYFRLGNINKTPSYSESCSKCQIRLKTGKLVVGTGERLHPIEMDASIVLIWKRNICEGMIYPCDKSRQQPVIENDVIILVDFLPAIEVTKDSSSDKHLCYLVPKGCKFEHNTCWKVSHCTRECQELKFASAMHRHCYMSLKFFLDYIECELQGIPEGPKTYMLKTAVLLHIHQCTDKHATIDSCVLKIINFLSDMYRHGYLPHLVLGFNLLEPTHDPHLPQEDKTWSQNRNEVMSKCWNFIGHVFRNIESVVPPMYDFDTVQTVMKVITLEYGKSWRNTDYRDLFLPDEPYFIKILHGIAHNEFPPKSELENIIRKTDKYLKDRYQGQNRSMLYMCMLRGQRDWRSLREMRAEFDFGMTQKEVQAHIQRSEEEVRLLRETVYLEECKKKQEKDEDCRTNSANEHRTDNVKNATVVTRDQQSVRDFTDEEVISNSLDEVIYQRN